LTTSTSPSRHFPRPLAVSIAGLILVFNRPILALARLSLESQLNSHVLLVPVISLFLIWLGRDALPPPSKPNRAVAALAFAGGLAALAGGGWRALRGHPELGTALELAVIAMLLFAVGLCAWFLGRRTLRAIAFPLGFLVFTLPMPDGLADKLNFLLQHASAPIAGFFFDVFGIPTFRTDFLIFRLPGITLEVAPECSGLNSSLALLIVSLPAGYLFLRSPWKRAALALVTIPLGIVRNGFRIFVIGELCVHYGPRMIDSYIHRTGGWMFFLLALVPFILIILALARSERPAPAKPAEKANA